LALLVVVCEFAAAIAFGLFLDLVKIPVLPDLAFPENPDAVGKASL
jgi:hypothetical protein